jgi:predicted enzyme related to lactoylglutathione lyase
MTRSRGAGIDVDAHCRRRGPRLAPGREAIPALRARAGIEQESRSPEQTAQLACGIDTATATTGATMTRPATDGVRTLLHPVSDLAKAKPVYAALLGVDPQADAPYYVGFEAAGQQIGLVPGGGPPAMTSPIAFWHVADIETKLAEVTAAGATVKEAPRDVGGGRLVATFADPDGNVLGLLQDR